jgi:hypothetical protein
MRCTRLASMASWASCALFEQVLQVFAVERGVEHGGEKALTSGCSP